MNLEAQQALRQATALVDFSSAPSDSPSLPVEQEQQWVPNVRSEPLACEQPAHQLAADLAFELPGDVPLDEGPPSTAEHPSGTREPQKYASMGPPPALTSVSPPNDVLEWRAKFFNVSQNPVTLRKQQWDDLWVWVDNIWTPRRVPYTKKDGTVHYEWRCRYHKKSALPSQSTGKRKREIRRGYGCPARMTANLMPDTRTIQVEGFEVHNHALEELDSTKICSGVRKWTSMHVQMGLQPKQIDALVNGKENPEAGTREALDTAGGKLLDEKTIRNIARRWRWPAAKFNMRQDDLFRELHSQHNTFPFAIQEPEAFHHDVCEISGIAQNADELHHLLEERKNQRLHALDEQFDTAASHLTRDPSPVGQQHWDRVLQLFRDRSYDSLVHYFAAYIQAEGTEENQQVVSGVS